MSTSVSLELSAVRIVSGVAFVAAIFCTVVWFGHGVTPVAAQSFAQSAKCGAFYDKWDVAGAPAGMLAIAGMLHETLAARDCIDRKNTVQACDHYRRVLTEFGRLDPVIGAEHGPAIKARMAEISCQ